MKNKEIYKTKLSRRLFSQFFISAFIPVLVLSVISFYTVSELLERNATRQIYAESRAVGLTLYDRILTAESNLLNLSKVVNENKESIKSDGWSKKIYSSLYIVNIDSAEEIFFGDDVVPIKLTDAQLNHLEKNKRLLLISDTDDNQARILMVNALSPQNNRFMVAVLNPDYLWDITTKESDAYCVSVEHKTLVYCPIFIDQVEKFQELKAQLFSVRSKGLQEIFIEDKQYLSNIWDIFLEANFNLNSMSVIYLMPKKNALQEYDYYVDALPLSMAITLLLVIIISSVQMRRSLTPLMKLIQGARKIITGDFTKKVNIKSNDEFEVLGSTFNAMVNRIGEQFERIKSLADIDRLILSTSDTDYIAKVLIDYIPSVVAADNVAILLVDPEVINEGALYFKKTIDSELDKSKLILNESELKELANTKDVIQKTNEDDLCCLSPLVELSIVKFFISPIQSHADVLGVICLGYYEDTELDDVLRTSLIEMADRAAVAFSNANSEKKLYHQAHHDSLTDLPNRFLFQDNLQNAINQAINTNTAVGLLFIDLDRFKSVNDSLGHSIGDDLLIQVSKIFKKCAHLYDSVSRFGGDEFVIIVSGLKQEGMKDQTRKIANEIIELMSVPIVMNNREFHIDPSIGIAIFPGDANNLNDLLKNADTAMYEAKSVSTGTGTYRNYKKQQNKEILARLELENYLRHALEKDEFELYYQPKINLHDSKIYSVEALIRWHHPEQGMVSPGIFVPLAEEIGLITDIGFWVMKTACEQSKVWNDNGIELNIAINISTDQFRQPNLYENMVAILDETGVNPDTIELEITESSTIENFPKTIRLLNQFKEHGLKISIDDFGTGHSSMTYLQKIPIDKLKIDKSFIDNINLRDDSASITKAIVALAHSLSLTVVAEGVETKAQYDFLEDIHCDEAQGFFLSRPLPEKELIQHILLYNIQSVSSN
jgi:diguanylate cyclase (GGDEF)-like protein